MDCEKQMSLSDDRHEPCTLTARRLSLSRRRFLGQLAAATTLASGLTFSSGLPAALAASLPAPWQAGSGRPRVLGHDLSTLQQLEDVGKRFSDQGRILPAEQIVARHGATFIRERLWVQPPIPYNDLPHILTMARRIKAAGLHFLLDFHYSDFWADPSHQTTPQSWQGQDLATLAQTVYDYTRSVLGALARQGTLPEMVQTGNEVTAGMLWPQGQIYVNGTERWSQFATLLKAAIAAVRDTSRAIEVMIHIDRGGDNAGSRYFFDHVLAQGVDFDVIGLSYYPWWHGPLSALQANLNDLAPRYGKDLVVVETAYPWTLTDGDSEPNIVNAQTTLLPGYPPTPEGQLAYIRAVRAIVEQVPQGRGRGLVYWESAWIPGVGWEPGAGDAWDNLTLFDRQGRALPSIRCYQ